MAEKISIVISKNPDGYSVDFPGLEPINYRASSLDGVWHRLKETLATHLNISETETPEEYKLNLNFPEEELKPLPSDGKEIMKFAGSWEDLPNCGSSYG